MVLAVGAQVLGELVDALGEQGHLDLGLAGVGVALAELGDQLLLALLGHGHAAGEASRALQLGPQSSRVCLTSRRICSTSASTLSNRRSPRRRLRKSIWRMRP